MVEDFLRSRLTDLSRDTYRYALKRFQGTGGGSPVNLTPERVQEWVQAVSREGRMARQTVRGTITALRALHSHLKDLNPAHRHPFEGHRVRLPRLRDTEAIRVQEKVISQGNLSLVLKRLDDATRERGREFPGAFLFRFLSLTGLRISEALSLSYYDPGKISHDGYENYLRKEGDGRWMVRVRGKAHRLREVRLGLELSAFLDARVTAFKPQPGEPVFRVAGGQRRLSRSGAHRQAREIARRFMADLPGGVAGKYGWHHLRHSLASRLLVDLGVDPVHVARTLGHSPAVLVQFYMHGTRDILRDLTV